MMELGHVCYEKILPILLLDILWKRNKVLLRIEFPNYGSNIATWLKPWHQVYNKNWIYCSVIDCNDKSGLPKYALNF